MNGGSMAQAGQMTLRPSDVVVACQLVISSTVQFAAISEATGISVGECHGAVQRLVMASLVSPISRRSIGELLVRFLVSGVPHAFPPAVGPAVVGVVTAHSAPVFSGLITAPEPYVWPDLDGTVRGLALTPLFPRAGELVRRNAPLYTLLTIVDALRVGHTREKEIAERLLRERMTRPGE
jgi:hypothetical protein